QMMHIAPGLGESVALIALQSIMNARATKLGRHPNGVKRRPSSARMSGVVGESIRRADMDPPALFAHSHPSFILVDHARFHHSRFELRFHSGQLLMARFDKGGNAACRELDSKPLLQQLARTGIGNGL